MSNINDPTTTANKMAVDASGGGTVKILDSSGNPVSATSDAAPTTVGGIVGMGINDRTMLPFRTDRLGNMASSYFNLLLADSFETNSGNSDRYTTQAGMTVSQQTTSGLLFNNGLSVLSNSGYLLQSTKKFQKTLRTPLGYRVRARLTYTNTIMEMGLSENIVGNTTTHTCGAYFQATTSGIVQPVVTYNSVDVTGTAITIDPTNFYIFDILIDDAAVTFTVQDTSTGLIINKQTIKTPLTTPRMFSAIALTAMVRLWNVPPGPLAACQLTMTDLCVYELDANKNRAWNYFSAANSKGTIQHPVTGSQLQTWTNSLDLGAAALSNTAAGYGTYGGKYLFNAPAGNVTDYALFAINVPALFNLFITGITIDARVLGAASATTPTLLLWGIGTGSTAVSLATATLNRFAIGTHSIPVGTAIGTAMPPLVKNFTTPIHAVPARFFHIILRVPVGTATASQTIGGIVSVEGYWE